MRKTAFRIGISEITIVLLMIIWGINGNLSVSRTVAAIAVMAIVAGFVVTAVVRLAVIAAMMYRCFNKEAADTAR